MDYLYDDETVNDLLDTLSKVVKRNQKLHRRVKELETTIDGLVKVKKCNCN